MNKNILANNFNSKDYILNNIINNIRNVESNINEVNNYDLSDNNLDKKFNFKYEDNINNNNSLDKSKIIKVIKMNPFNLCLFALFPNKFTNQNSNLLKLGLYKFREKLDVVRLFRIGLLNDRAIGILKKNSSLLSFDKEDLVIEADVRDAKNKNINC